MYCIWIHSTLAQRIRWRFYRNATLIKWTENRKAQTRELRWLEQVFFLYHTVCGNCMPLAWYLWKGLFCWPNYRTTLTYINKYLREWYGKTARPKWKEKSRFIQMIVCFQQIQLNSAKDFGFTMTLGPGQIHFESYNLFVDSYIWHSY